MQNTPVAPQLRYRAENHRQPRSSSSSRELLLAANCCSMVPSSESSEPCVTRRPRVAELPPSDEERAPEAGTSESVEQQAAEARPGEPVVEAGKKKQDRVAKDKDVSAASCFGGVEPARRPALAAEESARERLKRHRTEMAGRVRVPDMWGQERLLQDWVDCAVFDRPLAATAGLLNARDALVAECAAARRATGRPLRVQNGCL